jgi:hypothetical protein
MHRAGRQAQRHAVDDDLPIAARHHRGRHTPERHAKLRRFQEIINGEVGSIPLFTEFDNVAMRELVQGYVSYPDGIAFLSKLSLG